MGIIALITVTCHSFLLQLGQNGLADGFGQLLLLALPAFHGLSGGCGCGWSRGWRGCRGSEQAAGTGVYTGTTGAPVLMAMRKAPALNPRRRPSPLYDDEVPAAFHDGRASFSAGRGATSRLTKTRVFSSLHPKRLSRDLFQLLLLHRCRAASSATRSEAGCQTRGGCRQRRRGPPAGYSLPSMTSCMPVTFRMP